MCAKQTFYDDVYNLTKILYYPSCTIGIKNDENG